MECQDRTCSHNSTTSTTHQHCRKEFDMSSTSLSGVQPLTDSIIKDTLNSLGVCESEDVSELSVSPTQFICNEEMVRASKHAITVENERPENPIPAQLSREDGIYKPVGERISKPYQKRFVPVPQLARSPGIIHPPTSAISGELSGRCRCCSHLRTANSRLCSCCMVQQGLASLAPALNSCKALIGGVDHKTAPVMQVATALKQMSSLMTFMDGFRIRLSSDCAIDTHAMLMCVGATPHSMEEELSSPQMPIQTAGGQTFMTKQLSTEDARRIIDFVSEMPMSST